MLGSRTPAAAGAGSLGRRLWSGAISIAVLVAAFVLLAPPRLGGGTSYAITSGVSMLPHYHAGDFVVLRKQSSYRVGQVAAYHNAQLRVVVLHRVVAIDGDRYVFKGDNNHQVDSYEPTAAEVVGAERLHLAGAGTYVEKLRRPSYAAAALAALWFLSFARPSRSSRRRRRHRHAR